MSKRSSVGTHRRLYSYTQTNAIQIFEESQSRMLKPLPNREFKELIEKHNQILKGQIQNQIKPSAKVKFIASSSKIFNQDSDSHKNNTKTNFTQDITVNDLSKDFMQIVNLPQKDEKESQQQYLLCDIDPKSELYEPIESLRKLLLKESDDEEDYLDYNLKPGDSSDDDRLIIKDNIALPLKKGPKKKRERVQLEIYMDSIEQEMRKKIQNQFFGIDIIKELQEFYQSCFTSLMLELAPINFDLKKVANRISNGVELVFQSLLRHHVKEVSQLKKTIEDQKEEISYVKQSFMFLRNDILMINRMAPQVYNLLGDTNGSSQNETQATNSPTRRGKSSPATHKEQFMNEVLENEENQQAINQIQTMIELRNQHDLKRKRLNQEFSLDQYHPTDVEQNLKNLLSDIKSFQDKNMNEIRIATTYEKDEHEINYQLEKQQKILKKDWTGERNQKIKEVEKKLVQRMIERMNKPQCKTLGIQTEERYITEEEFERVVYLNTQFHKQLAINGQVFSQKENQIDELSKQYLIADLNQKRIERQLNDIKLLNSVKKNYLQLLKKEYEDIVMGILNLCVKYVQDIRSQNIAIREDENISEDVLDILNEQKKGTEDYLFALIESKKVMDDLHKSQEMYRANRVIRAQISEQKKQDAALQKQGTLKKQRSKLSPRSSSAESTSSNDSVKQVMNSKIEYKNSHIKHYEKAKLNQRYSIAPQMLKQQISKISQYLEEQQDLRRSSNSRRGPSNLFSSRARSEDEGFLTKRKSLPENLNNNKSNSPEQMDPDANRIIDVNIKKDRTLRGNHDDSGVRLSAQGKYSEDDFQRKYNLINGTVWENLANLKNDKDAPATPSPKKKISLKVFSEDQKMEIAKKPQKFEDFVKSIDGDVKQRDEQSELFDFTKNNSILSENSPSIDTSKFSQKIRSQKKNGLTEIQEETDESNGGITAPQSAKNVGTADGRGSKNRNAIYKVVPTDHKEVQTEVFLDEVSKKINSAINFLIQISDNIYDFKTEVQNISIATRMMSEAKINQIRQIFRHLIQKSQSDQVVNKMIGPLNQGVMMRMQQAISEQQKAHNQSNPKIKMNDSMRQTSGMREDIAKAFGGGGGGGSGSEHNSKPASRNNTQDFRISQQSSRQNNVMNSQSIQSINHSNLNQTQQSQESIVNVAQMLSQLNNNPKTGNGQLQHSNTQVSLNSTAKQQNSLNAFNKFYPQSVQQNQPTNANSKAIPIKINISEQLGKMNTNIQMDGPYSIQQNTQQNSLQQTQTKLTAQYNNTNNKNLHRQTLSATDWNYAKEFVGSQGLNSREGGQRESGRLSPNEEFKESNLTKQILNQNQIIYSYGAGQDQGENAMNHTFYNKFNQDNGFAKQQEQQEVQQNSSQSQGMLKNDSYVNLSEIKATNESFQNTDDQPFLRSSPSLIVIQNLNRTVDVTYQGREKNQKPVVIRQLTLDQQKQVQHVLSSSMTEEQKFYYLRLIQDQLSQPEQSMLNHPLTNFLANNPAQRRRRSKKQPILEPITAIKLNTTGQNSVLHQSKSMSQLSRVIPSTERKDYSINSLTSENHPEPSFTDKRLDQLSRQESERQEHRSKIFKDIIQNYTELKKSRVEREALKFRDRKKSLEDMEKQQINYSDTVSYSKEGRRLDYMTFNI